MVLSCKSSYRYKHINKGYWYTPVNHHIDINILIKDNGTLL